MPHPTNFRYVGHQNSSDDFSLTPSNGGDVFQSYAAGTLNVGDVVQVSSTGVAKATNNPTRVVGVVVGGASLPNYLFEAGAANAPTLIAAGVVAATVGQLVYVMRVGFYYVVCDGVISTGALLKQSGSTAGQVTTATASTDAGQIIGKLYDGDSAIAGDVRLALIALM